MKYLLGFLLLAISFVLHAQVDPVDKNGIAIDGYDVVAYFKSNKAIKGADQYTSTHNQIKYYFSSAENKKAFDENPEIYLPQFEGYCALAVSYGKKISIDPETFKVSGNKLYLFYHGKTSKGKINSLETWNKNEDRLLKKARELWPDVKKSKYKSGAGL